MSTTQLIEVVGGGSLAGVVLLSILVLLVSLAAVRFESETLRRAARRGIAVLALLLTVASGALLVALVNGDFHFSYVARYTEKALPLGYKLAAFWAGQEGSLLLWAWLLAVMGAIFAYWHRRETGGHYAGALAVLAAVIAFFGVLMLFANSAQGNANPFTLLPVAPADGRGLNPLLQDIWMLAHPPVLFVGYAGFTIPFALLVGAVFSGRLDNAWVAMARPWALVSWLFLGAGIVMGSKWAYIELGWGGYWAWDPVENASLLPWLTGTILLHSIFAQQRRGSFKRWAASMAALTFILCIFGTWVTRSGVVSSVHTFGKSLIGDFFLAVIILSSLLSIGLLAWAWRRLRPENPVEDMFSKDAAILAGNVLLLVMMLLTLVGTMMPVFSRPFIGLLGTIGVHIPLPTEGQGLAVRENFYNATVLPVGMVLVAIMAIAPLLAYGKTATERLLRDLRVPAILGGVAVLGTLLLGAYSPWAWMAAAVGGVIVGTIAVDLVRSLRARQRIAPENVLTASLRLLDGNRRRYGGYLAHVGLAMFVVGVVGSGVYGTKQDVQLRKGESVTAGRYTVRFDALRETRRANYEALTVDLTVTKPNGRTTALRPERRGYFKHEEQAFTEVGLLSTWREDLFVTLAAWEPDGSRVALEVRVLPLVWWLWAGGIVMALGAIYGLMPSFLPQTAAEEADEPPPLPIPTARKAPKGEKRTALALEPGR